VIINGRKKEPRKTRHWGRKSRGFEEKMVFSRAMPWAALVFGAFWAFF
jgi:hypothetical protein